MAQLFVPNPSPGLTTGYSDRIDTTDQVGRPGGIESIFEYNGTYLNVRSWFDTYLINQIDGLADIDVRDSREVNPGRDGETAFSAYYGGRTITLTGKIRAQTLAKMRNMEMGLKQIFSDINQEFPLIVRTGDTSRDVMIYCKKSQPLVMTEVQQDMTYRRDFQVTLRASRPFFVSFNLTSIRSSFDLGFREELATDAVVRYVNVIRNTSGQFDSTADWSTRTVNTSTDNPGTVSVVGSARGLRGRFVNPGVTRSDGTAYPGTEWSFYDNSAILLTGPRLDVTGLTNTAFAARLRLVSYREYGTVFGFCIGFYEYDASGREYRAPYPPNPYPSPRLGTGRILYPSLGAAETLTFVTRNFTSGITSIVPFVGLYCRDYAYTRFGKPPNNGEIGFVNAGLGTFEFDVEDFTVVVSNTLMTTGEVPPFDGDSPNSRWIGGRARTSSEYLASTGLESIYSFISGTGNASVRSGKIYANAQGDYVRLRRLGFTRVRSFSTLIEVNTGNPSIASTGDIKQMKMASDSQWVYGKLAIAGANSTLSIGTEILGNPETVLNTSSRFSIAANTSYWFRVIFERNLVTAELWNAHPDLGGTAAQTTNYTLTSTDATNYGQDVTGDVGIGFPSGDNWMYAYIDNHQVRPSSNLSDFQLEVTNDGNSPADPIIRIFGPVNSTVSGGNAATIRHDPNGTPSNLTLNAPPGSTVAVARDDYIEIDVAARTMKLYYRDGTFRSNAYNQLDPASDWWQLVPGTNLIQFLLLATGSPAIQIDHRHTYI